MRAAVWLTMAQFLYQLQKAERSGPLTGKKMKSIIIIYYILKLLLLLLLL